MCLMFAVYWRNVGPIDIINVVAQCGSGERSGEGLIFARRKL